ncbi:hypothetical protein [Lysobacter gummosus]|uniref:hypothetical protein n=1 Tax=Lysobacter gummosus TaxID=262324 RepID=UPI00363FBC2C
MPNASSQKVVNAAVSAPGRSEAPPIPNPDPGSKKRRVASIAIPASGRGCGDLRRGAAQMISAPPSTSITVPVT